MIFVMKLLQKDSLLQNNFLGTSVAFIALFFLFSCNNKFLRKSAIPDTSLSNSEKLNYMVETGEQDRRSNLLRYFIFPNGKKIKSVIQRDSARCAYFLSLEKEFKPSEGQDKMNAGLLLLHGDGVLSCRDTINLSKSMRYFKDLKDNGPGIGDKKNGETWYPQALRTYTYLVTECQKRKKKSK